MGRKKNPVVQFINDGLPSNDVIDSIAGYMENITGAVMNGGSVFDQYLENFTTITANNTCL